MQDPILKLKTKNVESQRVKKVKLSFSNKVKKLVNNGKKLFNGDGIMDEKQLKRNVFKLNKKTKKASTVERIPVKKTPVSWEMQDLDPDLDSYKHGTFARAHYHEKDHSPEVFFADHAETSLCDDDDPGDLLNV